CLGQLEERLLSSVVSGVRDVGRFVHDDVVREDGQDIIQVAGDEAVFERLDELHVRCGHGFPPDRWGRRRCLEREFPGFLGFIGREILEYRRGEVASAMSSTDYSELFRKTRPDVFVNLASEPIEKPGARLISSTGRVDYSCISQGVK